MSECDIAEGPCKTCMHACMYTHKHTGKDLEKKLRIRNITINCCPFCEKCSKKGRLDKCDPGAETNFGRIHWGSPVVLKSPVFDEDW